MTHGPHGVPRIQAVQADTVKAQQARSQHALAQHLIIQAASESGMSEQCIDHAAFSPHNMSRRFESLEKRSTSSKGSREDKSTESKKEGKAIVEVKEVEEVSEQYYRKNPELQERSLSGLRGRLKKSDSEEDILRKVLETFDDYTLADEALDFIIETSDPEMAFKAKAAKEHLNTRFGREVRAGRNINEAARSFSQTGLGSPTELRNLYRDITGNPREPPSLFEELSSKYNFEQMKPLIDFLLSSLGSDLASKGASIARAELHRLMTDVRTLQAILGLYRYFKSRMQMIRASFTRAGLYVPGRITFEFLAKIFMKYLGDRYPGPDKVLQLAVLLGIVDELDAQGIVFLQMRDATRQISPRFFKSEQHRQDVLTSFNEALEEIDEKIEEKEEETEDEEEKEEE